MISLSEILHTIAQALMIPCLIILIILMAGAVWQIGDIVVEYIAERRKHKCDVPQLLRDVHAAGADGLAELIENSGLLRRQKKALLELAESRNLPKDTLTALAERLLATEEARNARTTSVTDMIAKLGPMFGLLGTLIPLGPGIVALGQGDTVTLSESMNVAFDTTIAGVISAAVASVISHIRKRWYNDDSLNVPDTALPGLFGQATGVIQNLIVLGEVHAGSTAEEYYYAAGGIVCYGDNVTVQNCGFYGTIYSGNNTYGAILGSGIGATVRNCWNYVVDEDIWSEYIFNNRTNLPSCIVISSDDSGESMDVSKLATLNTDIPNTGKMWAWSEGETYPRLIDPPKTITMQPVFPDCTAAVSANGTPLTATNGYTYEVEEDAVITVSDNTLYYAASESEKAYTAGGNSANLTKLESGTPFNKNDLPKTYYYGTEEDFRLLAAWNSALGRNGNTATVATADQLKALARMVNSGKDSMASKAITLGANIVLELDGSDWTPIGMEKNPFKGTFNGGTLTGNPVMGRNLTTYTISGLTGNLFGVVNSGNNKTAIQYVTISGGTGRLVGELKSGTVQYCMSTAKVTGSTGGLVGQNSGTVNSCYYGRIPAW